MLLLTPEWSPAYAAGASVVVTGIAIAVAIYAIHRQSTDNNTALGEERERNRLAVEREQERNDQLQEEQRAIVWERRRQLARLVHVDDVAVRQASLGKGRSAGRDLHGRDPQHLDGGHHRPACGAGVRPARQVSAARLLNGGDPTACSGASVGCWDQASLSQVPEGAEPPTHDGARLHVLFRDVNDVKWSRSTVDGLHELTEEEWDAEVQRLTEFDVKRGVLTAGALPT